MSKKRIYDLEDLYNLISAKKTNYNFSSDETGYQLSVQVPAQFEVMKENGDDSLLFCRVKLMHSGENRNHSNVTEDALIKASKTLAYKPILANFMEYTDENGETLKDFTSHDMELNNDGSTTYLEKQVGCFTADDPSFEVEEDTGHNFMYGYCAIPVGYTDAASIIQRKNGTKVSAELGINALEFNTATGVLDLTDVVILGATCLGKDPETLENVGEGMKNARLDIVDFSVENNGIINRFNEDMLEMRARLEKLESAYFNKNEKDNQKKGGNASTMNMFEKLLAQYNKTAEDITFDYSGLSDEELEAKFVEMFGEDTTTSTGDEGSNGDNDNGNDNEGQTDPAVSGDGSNEPAADPSQVSEDGNGENSDGQNFAALKKEFSISHEDIRWGLYNLLSAIESDENDWYYITNVYDNYFVYENWDGNKIFGQKYSVEDDSVAFDGDRYVLHKEYLTDAEYAELKDMRSNYAALKEFKETFEENELHAKREEILNAERYSVISAKDEDGNYTNKAFAALVAEMDNYSLTELEMQVKVIHSDFIAEQATFSATEISDEKKPVSKKNFVNPSSKKDSKPSRYGHLFQK